MSRCSSFAVPEGAYMCMGCRGCASIGYTLVIVMSRERMAWPCFLVPIFLFIDMFHYNAILHVPIFLILYNVLLCN